MLAYAKYLAQSTLTVSPQGMRTIISFILLVIAVTINSLPTALSQR